ncbi:hypothetical protein KFK09_012315 [Dendrobium nobile]|uniref:Uncharacterized protein n=1 Tax=Dendrobium nobile TaxID=94219 RepID=A0A8T3BGY9_DENNO|nr:hypothetical protein KFK09_012315 [Dendrobium nobile]
MEAILDAGKSLLWFLCVMGSSGNGANLFGDGCEISEPIPENKDDGESVDEEDEDEVEASDQEDDGGEEDYSGDEGDEEELKANGGGGSKDEDGDSMKLHPFLLHDQLIQ